MNRTRVVAVVSAILGSTAGCLVLSRWRLAGTITGAVVVPVIYTLVSHCSTESLDRLGKWARRLVHRRKSDTDLPEAETAPRTKTVSIEEAPGAETARTPAPRAAGARLQWSLVAFAFLAFATSVYSLVQAEPAQQTIVREKVIENRIVQKTVTVTSPASLTSSAAAAVSGTSSTTLPAEGAGDGQDAGGGVVTTSSTTTTLAPGPTY
jgi:hypothetical protein